MSRAKAYVRLGLVLAALAAGGFAAAGRVELRAEAEAPGPFVLLSDVAEVVGVDDPLGAELERLTLGVAPGPSGKVLTREYVACRLKQAGFGDESLILCGAESVKVRPGERRRDRMSELIKATRNHVARVYGLRPEDMKVEVGELLREEMLAGWGDGWEVKVMEPSSASGKLPGRVGVVAKVGEGEREIRLSFSAEVSVWKEVVVAKGNIPRRRVILAGDISLERVLLSEGGIDASVSLSEVVGRKAVQTITKGSVIDRRAVEELPLVRRGDMVVAEFRGEGFAIRTWAKAREVGKRGDTIEVENPRSREVFLATVVGEKAVEVLQ